MSTTPDTPTPTAGEDRPPTPEQLVAEVVAWLDDMPPVRRALIASILVDNRWTPTFAALCRQAVAELVAAAREQAVPQPYEHVAKQLGVGDDYVDRQPITGDPAEHFQRLVRKLSPDGDAGTEPADAEVGEADRPAPRTGAPH